LRRFIFLDIWDFDRFQQHPSNKEKKSTKIVDGDVSSYDDDDDDDDESGSEEQDEEKLPVVIVKSRLDLF
jgi:hypothetical protein